MTLPPELRHELEWACRRLAVAGAPAEALVSTQKAARLAGGAVHARLAAAMRAAELDRLPAEERARLLGLQAALAACERGEPWALWEPTPQEVDYDDEEPVKLLVRVPRLLRDRLRLRAERAGVTMTDYVARLIRDDVG